MTTITVFQSENGQYTRFTCDGHAGMAAYGKDIVCASISCLVITTINALHTLVHESMQLKTDEDRGWIDCSFDQPLSEKGTLLMDTMLLGLNGIIESYGKKYLKLKFKEV